MAFRFRLQPLLRKVELEQRQLHLQITQLQTGIAEQESLLAEALSRVGVVENEQASIACGQQYHWFAQRRASALDKVRWQRRRLTDMEAMLVGLRHEMQQLQWRLNQLEKARDMARTKWKRERLQKEQLELDEQTVLRFRRSDGNFW